MPAVDLLLGSDSELTELNLRLLKSMIMFIQRAPAAIFACTFMKALFTSAATTNLALMALIYTVEK